MPNGVTGTMTCTLPNNLASDFLIGGKFAPENIVEARAQIANCLIAAVRPGSVCQKSDRDSSIQVDPKRRAGESEMAD